MGNLDKNTRNVIIVLALIVSGVWVYQTFIATPPDVDQGAVGVYGNISNAGNSTAVNTGTVSVFSGTSPVATDTVSSGAWDAQLNPGDYVCVFEAANYYVSTWSISVPSEISGTRTYNAGSHGVYPVAATYSITFSNETTVIASKTNAAQTDLAWKEGITQHTYTLTVSDSDDYSSFGIPATINYPGRESVGNYIVLTFNTSNVVCPEALATHNTASGKIFVLAWSPAIAGSASGGSSRSLSLQFTSAASYTCEAYLYSYTNEAQIEKYLAGNAPAGFTLASYQFGTTIAITIA